MEAWRHSDWNIVIVFRKLDSILAWMEASFDEHLETQGIQCPKVLFCISKIIMTSLSMSIIPVHTEWETKSSYLFYQTVRHQTWYKRYGFIEQMHRALKEYRNTFQLNEFHPRIISSSSDSYIYGYKVQISKEPKVLLVCSTDQPC